MQCHWMSPLIRFILQWDFIAILGRYAVLSERRVVHLVRAWFELRNSFLSLSWFHEVFDLQFLEMCLKMRSTTPQTNIACVGSLISDITCIMYFLGIHKCFAFISISCCHWNSWRSQQLADCWFLPVLFI